MFQKFVVILRTNRKRHKIMLQTQSYSNVLNLAFLLPIKEQQQLIRDVQTNLNRGQTAEHHRYSWEELHAEVQEAEDQIARGACYTSDEDDQLFDEFITKELNVAL